MRIGADIEEHGRFRRLVEKPSFVERVYTPTERRYIQAAGKRAHLAAAGLFCAKEAAAKALGLGLFGLRPNEIEIDHDEKGAPILRLLGAAKARFPQAEFSLSISHSREYFIAAALAWNLQA